MRKLLIAATLALLALPTAASAATKTYDVERIHIRIRGDFSVAGGPGRGWVFMQDISGVMSTVEAVLLGDEGSVFHRCNAGVVGSKNIVQVGTFAQSATANMAPIPAENSCRQISTLTVKCTYEGTPAGQAREHLTINHTGTYKGAAGVASSYTITGHRDVVSFCDVVIDGQVFEGEATLSRFRSSHTGDTRFVDFWRDPVSPIRGNWLNLDDVTFPF